MLDSKLDRDYVMLKPMGCQYLGPDYDPRDHKSRTSPTPYCGQHDLVPGKLYCAHHYPLLFQVGTAHRKRHKDIRKANAIRQLISDFDAVVAELEAEGFDFDIKTVDQELV